MKTINQEITEQYALYNGDSCEVIKSIPDESIGFSVFSPPFANLYTYSNSPRDMGNCKDDVEFFDQFRFLISELLRVMKPGRIIAVHCMNLPTSKQNHGHIGMRDFRGNIIREFEDAGFYYHSEVCIWKDPVVAMQRTKALGLLHKTIKKDSTMSRQGIPDTLCMFRKPGINDDPVAGEFTHYVGSDHIRGFKGDTDAENRFVQYPVSGTSIDVWQRYASPIWHDINQTRTLQYKAGRSGNDERHICPLQLDVIERAMQLWSKEGDTVFTPFLGIGSEAYVAVKMGRKAIGIELKSSYFDLAVKNLKSAEINQYDMFGDI